MLDKFAIAAALQEIASLLELRGGENRFKARAYRAGARAISSYSGDIGEVVNQNQLTGIRGIGNALASQISQLYLHGSSTVLDSLRKEFPPGVIELAAIPGLTLGKIRTLHETLGVKSVEDLRAAAEAGRVRDVKGFGSKTEQALLESIINQSKRVSTNRRLHIHQAERIARTVIDYLNTAKGLGEAAIAGSLRRRKETVGVIQITATAKKPPALVEHFLRFPLIVRTETRDKTSCVVELLEGARVSLNVVPQGQYPVALLAATGAPGHVQRLQSLAEKKKIKLDIENYALSVNGKQSTVGPVESEADIYRRLGLQFVPPELREDAGEIEAALAGKLPEDLVTLEDIQGMVHCHTTYSDGVGTVAEMARAAEAMGMKYMTITDHSPTAFYAGGVKPDRLLQQWDEIDEVQQSVKVRLLKGTESDILADGSLDYPDKILEKFDIIVASIHSRYKMNAEQMTRRILKAMRQPVFKIWGHALGRLLERRPPIECDVETILDAIAESRAAVEINGDPYRLDLEPRWIREARKRKIKFVVSVDAHSVGALNNVSYGIGIARRGWVRKREVLNTLGTKQFMTAVRPGG